MKFIALLIMLISAFLIHVYDMKNFIKCESRNNNEIYE